MVSKKMEAALNAQMNAEMYSGYLYLAMSAYFEEEELPGFAHWMRIQAAEELEHGLKFFDYILRRNAHVSIEKIDKPETSWEDAKAVFEQVSQHEKNVTGMINELVDLAISEKDHATNNFLQWFVAEQVEEEENADGILGQVKRAIGSPTTLLLLDGELANRPAAGSSE